MNKPGFLPVLRALAECYQSFEHYSARHIRQFGLTPPQFDIVATLGNTDGMTFRQLGERTLITKGTLTGVVDRLEKQGLVVRRENPSDGRSQRVCLTVAGQTLFERVFPAHLAYLATVFEGRLNAQELQTLGRLLHGLRESFGQANGLEDEHE